jgi:hypothetical protein
MPMPVRASTRGLAWDRVPRRLRRSATPERSPYTAELPCNLSGVNELHAGLCRVVSAARKLWLVGWCRCRAAGFLYFSALPHDLALEDGEVVRHARNQAARMLTIMHLAWQEACKSSMDDLRHYFASLLIASGADVKTSRPGCVMPAPRQRSTPTATSGPTVTSPPAPPLRPSSQPGRNSGGTAVSSLHDGAGQDPFSRHTS